MLLDENTKGSGIVFGLLYYTIIGPSLFVLFLWGIFFDEIAEGLSPKLSSICYIYVPIFLLILPIIFKFILKKKFYKAIIYSFASVIIYLCILFLARLAIISYMSSFTTEKWNNPKYENLRYLMIDNLEEKHNIIGMNKEDIYALLGEEDGSFEEHNRIYYIIGQPRWISVEELYYCLEYDGNGVIINTYY